MLRVLLATVFLAACSSDDKNVAGPLVPQPVQPEGMGKTADERLLLALHERLGQNWYSFISDCEKRLEKDHPLNDRSLASKILLRIDPSGVLVDASIDRTSGNDDFDNATLEVAKDIPLIKVAAETLSDDGTARVYWTFARDERMASPKLAEVRRTHLPLTQAVEQFVTLGRWDIAAQRLRHDMLQTQEPTPEQTSATVRLLSVALENSTRSKDRGARVAAFQAIRPLPEVVTTQGLLEALTKAEDSEEKVSIILALEPKQDEEVTKRLELMLEEPDTTVASAAAGVLSRGGHKNSVEAYLARTKTDQGRLLIMLRESAVAGFDDDVTNIVSSATEAAATLGCQVAGARWNANINMGKALAHGLNSKKKSVRRACAKAIADGIVGRKSKALYWKVMEKMKTKDATFKAHLIVGAAVLAPSKFKDISYLSRKDSKSPELMRAWMRASSIAKFAHASKLKNAAAGTDDVLSATAFELAKDSNVDLTEQAKSVTASSPKSKILPAAHFFEETKCLEFFRTAVDHDVREAGFRCWVHKRGQQASASDVMQYVMRAQTEKDRILFASVWLSSSK